MKLWELLERFPIRRLSTGKYYSPSKGEFCTVGACAFVSDTKMSPSDLMLRSYYNLVHHGVHLNHTQLREVTLENDGFEGTQEERYNHMLGWLKERDL